jgi:hypothetical protein
MLDEMRANDEQLNASDIRQLENADEIAHFFAKLRYDSWFAQILRGFNNCGRVSVGEEAQYGRDPEIHDRTRR